MDYSCAFPCAPSPFSLYDQFLGSLYANPCFFLLPIATKHTFPFHPSVPTEICNDCISANKGGKKNQTTNKQARKVRSFLDDSYSYLAGNAFGRDKKGRVRKDDPIDMQHVGGAGESASGEYTAYVYYEMEFE